MKLPDCITGPALNATAVAVGTIFMASLACEYQAEARNSKKLEIAAFTLRLMAITASAIAIAIADSIAPYSTHTG